MGYFGYGVIGVVWCSGWLRCLFYRARRVTVVVVSMSHREISYRYCTVLEGRSSGWWKCTVLSRGLILYPSYDTSL